MVILYNNYNADYIEDCRIKGIDIGDSTLLDKIKSDFKGADYKWIFIALVLFMISNISRALRWYQLLEPLGYKPKFLNSIGAVMIAYLVNLGIPRSGEFVRAGVISKYEGFKAEKVMGTIVTDRIIDVICLLVMIFLGIALSYQTVGVYLEENLDLSQKFGFILNNPLVLILLALLGLGGVALLYWQRNTILKTGIGQKIVRLILGLWDGVKSIGKLKNPGLFIAHSILIWTLYFLMTYLCMFAFEPTSHLTASAGLAVFVMGAIGIVFPSPGGMGAYHYMISQGLMMYGLTEADGFSFANIIFFSIQLFCNILFGIIALLILPTYNSRYAKAA